ncbi:tyrosine-type recombinase/integrase [Lutispora sp.]|uniref:tyrosine-type recombinase/integrase n=1 Tax=Lutispora sp. TaxID=2828727 RepID=UPI003566D723
MLDKYRHFLFQNNKKENTIKAYSNNVNKFLNWLNERYGESTQSAITALDLREYQSYLLNIKKYSAAGILQRMNSVVSYCNYLYSENHLPIDVAKDFKFIKVQGLRSAPEIISTNEMNKYRREVHKAAKKRDIAIVELLLNTGIRASELISLEIDDIELSDRKGMLIVRDGKGGKYRNIPLNSDVRKALNEYLESIPVDMHHTSKLWIGQRGSLAQDGLNKLLKRYAARCGLTDKIHPHMFRHYFATKLVRDRKEDLVLVAYLLGYSDINTTKIYVQPNLDYVADALENLYIGA